MFYILIGIVVVALIGYLGVVFYQRYFVRQIKQLEAHKGDLMALPIPERLTKLRSLHLTGESLQNFERWQKQYEQLTNHNFSTIESYLFEAETANHKYNFIQVARILKQLRAYLTETDQDLLDVQDALENLLANEADTRQKIQQLRDQYQQLRKRLLTKSFSFGPALDALEATLGRLEIDFDQANALTTAGDHLGAKVILQKLIAETTQLEDQMKRIPKRYNELANEFPEQLVEINDTYQQMLNDDYQFDDRQIEVKQQHLMDQLDKSTALLSDLDIGSVEANNDEIANGIDRLYDQLEAEMTAKQNVTTQLPIIAKFVQHAEGQNHELLLELDHLNQSYALTHDELATTKQLQKQIGAEKVLIEGHQAKIAKHEAVYTAIAEDLAGIETRLTAVEKQQQAIHDQVANLHQGEVVANENLHQFELELRNLKRTVEKVNLPGLQKKYLDFFFVVSDEIQKLNHDLNQIKINLDEIAKQLILVQEDLDELRAETETLIDSAMLTEQLLQYANRYRTDFPAIQAACVSAQTIFNQEYDYAKAVDLLATALEKVDPGAYTQVEKTYYEQKSDSTR
ncbi:septation ring formation regulator EzrA [Latilactobacillus graminis]|uniref:Septation ring formation regulator EzrA n=2 Tax=Latilactobacillus graminis TaxID=60519 RepID=A0AA89I252_9LACO|nr:septation ring formation regulator EzrA [Latilactobacillus graminis]KRM22293.1 septation ring formation regulator, EzrA family protein [Latilactobacillus graminis DSM 20719]QFP79531.1 septation ring formation regulator EzrA [Latilactobacillus graminis]